MIGFELAITFIFSFILIFILIKKAFYLNLVDTPNNRSSHNKVTPTGAGIGFVLSFFITYFIFEKTMFLENWGVFLAIFLVYIVGILDDHKDTTPKTKFYVIFIASILVIYQGIYINSLGVFWGYEIDLWYIAFPFTVFAVAGFTNAMNLIDGLDGLAGTISLVILSSFAYIGMVFHDMLIITICFLLIASLSAFIYFNWNPAKIFMGDSGSLTLGFIISIIGILSLNYIHPVTVLYIMAIPIIDTLIVMTRRIRRGKSPFNPDKTHVHHILFKFFGSSVKKTVIFLSLLQVMFAFLGYIAARHIEQYPNGLIPFAMLVGFLIILILSYMIFTAMERRQKLIDKLEKRFSKR